MFGDWDVLIWAALAVGSLIASIRLMVIPLMKTINQATARQKKATEAELEEVNTKNIAKYGGAAIASEIERWAQGLELAHKQAMAIYVKQKEAVAQLTVEEQKKILDPLESKIKQIEFFMTHRETLKQVNATLTAPIIGKFIQKIAGGLL